MADDKKFTVVIGVDGSENSNEAVMWGLNHLTERGGGLIKLVMAWSYAPMQAIGFGMGGIVPDMAAMDEANHAALEELVARYDAPDGVEMIGIGREGGAAHAILEEARDADMVVVGKRGHGGFLGMVIGSVASQVANHASCPVVVIPSEPEDV